MTRKRMLMGESIKEYIEEYLASPKNIYIKEIVNEAVREAEINASLDVGIAFGVDKKIIIKRLQEAHGVPKEEAEKRYDAYEKSMK